MSEQSTEEAILETLRNHGEAIKSAQNTLAALLERVERLEQAVLPRPVHPDVGMP